MKERNAKVGRPRATAATTDEPARESILSAARALFRERGFSGTTTRAIAEAAGLRQPSIFHYFGNKEAIFRALALGAVDPVIDFLHAESAKLKPPAALYRLVRFDTLHLCTNDNVLGSVLLFPEMTRERMPEFWDKRDEIIDGYRRLLRAGKKAGLFDYEHLDHTTHLLFGFGESTLTWFEGNRRRAERVAEDAARLALRSVLREPDRLEEHLREADAA